MSDAAMKKGSNSSRVRFITTTGLMAAVLCILGPLSIPIGPVPISLTSFVIYLTLYILDTKRSLAAIGIYLLLGLAGLPVFSGFQGGAQKLFGPTGGYLIGFLPMALVIGIYLDKYYKNIVVSVIVMEAATWIIYLLGTLWLSIYNGTGFIQTMAAAVVPFIVLDLIKMAIAAVIGPVLRKRLRPLTSLE